MDQKNADPHLTAWSEAAELDRLFARRRDLSRELDELEQETRAEINKVFARNIELARRLGVPPHELKPLPAPPKPAPKDSDPGIVSLETGAAFLGCSTARLLKAVRSGELKTIVPAENDELPSLSQEVSLHELARFAAAAGYGLKSFIQKTRAEVERSEKNTEAIKEQLTQHRARQTSLTSKG